uniref:Palmitoleoyl-protein carboxylesterase notum1a-like n=1 Tax=Sinocyclocheilus rhinocerous TaxID=307959 RepID=A0A673FQD1_9TELE
MKCRRPQRSVRVMGVIHWAVMLGLIQSGALGARRFRGGRNPQQRRPLPTAHYRDRAETTESFSLDFTAVEENMDNFMTQVKNLAQSLYPCSAQKLDYDMKLHFLENTSVTCNDGTPAGYYLKESKGSRRWLIFLEGGWFCFNKENCDSRYETTRRLMSSSKWPQTKTERCRQAYEGKEWNCFFGYKVYPTIKRPVFIVQWLFDEAQLTVDNIHLTGQPVQEGQWRYIQNLGTELRNTLKDVPAMFAPACLSHEFITRNYWTDVKVKGTSLPRALHCWDRSLQENSRNNKSPPKGCPVHLIDSCPWPHCNPTCPTIRDQSTGQEMNVIQFLMHMGFDVQKMAHQQGMDPSKLLGMLSSGS